MPRNLPQFPNLDYLKKRAKVLLRELQQNNRGAKLTQAQHAIAREYGFASWPKLKAYAESLPRPEVTSLLSDPTPVHGSPGGGGSISGPAESEQDSGGGGGLFQRFTEKARRTIFFARYFARHEKRIEAEHLFRGVVQADAALMNRIAPGHNRSRLASEPEERARLTASLTERIPQLLEQMRHPRAGGGLSAGDSPLSRECRRMLDFAGKEADRLQHQKISTGHFLLAFLSEDVPQVTPILTESGIRLDTARDEITCFLSEERL